MDAAAKRDLRAVQLGDGLDYPWPAAPVAATVAPVAPGVGWLRMPLPFMLDHINLWTIAGEDGWWLVDSGLGRPEVEEIWERLFAGPLSARPVERLVATHFHPDHLGLAGWLAERCDVPLHITRSEWLTAAFLCHDTTASSSAAQARLFARHGVDSQRCAAIGARGNNYRRLVRTPPAYRRLRDGDRLQSACGCWQVVVTTGHSPEHACLWNEELGVLVAGDQVLPRISPNVSVWANEPRADPLAEFLASVDRLRELPADTLILPSHGLPFRGLHRRLDALAAHHAERLERLLEGAREPLSAADSLPLLFDRALDAQQLLFAMGESLAHLHYLENRGALVRRLGADGIERFGAAAG